MKWRFFKLLIGLLAVVAAGNAGVPVRSWWGEELMPEPAGVFLHPSRLTGYHRPVLFAGMGTGVLSEERTRLVYDQFENTIGEAVYADNISWSWYPGPFGGVYPWRGLRFAAGVAQRRDFSYHYLKEYRDEFYVRTGEDRVEQSGGLWDGVVTIGWSPFPALALGASGRYCYGERRLKQVQIRMPETSLVNLESSFRGLGWQVGAGYVPGSRMRLDLIYQSAVRMSGSDSLKQLPWCAGAVAELKVPGVLPARLLIEARLTGWSAVDSGLRNVLNINAGIEHRLLNRVLMSYGFGVEPLFSDPAVHRLQGRFGLGFDVDRLRFDVDIQARREELDAGDFLPPLVPADSRVYQQRLDLGVRVRYEI